MAKQQNSQQNSDQKKTKTKKQPITEKKKRLPSFQQRFQVKRKALPRCSENNFIHLVAQRKVLKKKKKSEGNDAKHEEEKKEKNVLQEW